MKLWDLYDSNLKNTGKVIPSGEEVPDGYYHIAIEIWIINSKKELLLIKNSIDYSRRYPGSWCSVGSSLISGESVDESINRVIKDKLGLDVSYEKLFISDPIKKDPYKYAYITCVLKADINISDIKLKNENVAGIQFVDKDKLLEMCDNGEVAYYLISRINDEVIKYLD